MKKNKPYGAAAALLAGALLGGLMTAPGAHAVDFRVKGVWIAMLEYGDGGSFVRKDREGKNVQGWGRWGEDRFEAKNRVRLQLDAAVSDALSGSVYFEIGGATWGRARSGGALGADGQIVKIKHSYLDWNLPGTGLKARMGLQRIFLPDFVTDASQVFDADVAGISVAAPLTEHLSLTAFWARAFNDNWAASDGGQSGWLDNADFFGLLLPVTYEDIRLTPWALLGTIGKNAFRHGNGRFYSRNSEGSYGIGLSPSAYRFDGRESSLAHATAFWAGLTGEITAARPLRLAWSAAWGSVATGDAALDTAGMPRPWPNTRWTGALPASTAGTAAAMTGIPPTVPSACPPSRPTTRAPTAWPASAPWAPGPWAGTPCWAPHWWAPGAWACACAISAFSKT